MKQKRLGGLCAAAIFLLCALMTGFYLIAGYGAYLDSDMASELALASHLAKEGALISSTWAYSTEVRVLSTQLVFTPLMALFPHNWRLVRTLGCLILQAALAASAYFCGRTLGARKRFALLFAGLSISVCSVVICADDHHRRVLCTARGADQPVRGTDGRLMTERKHRQAAGHPGAADRVVRADGGFFHSIPVLRDDSRCCGGRMGVSFPCRERERAERMEG